MANVEGATEPVDLSEALAAALASRASELKATPKDFSLAAIRRMLEKDVKLEPFYLDEHKGLVKDLLSEFFCQGSESDDGADEDAQPDSADAAAKIKVSEQEAEAHPDPAPVLTGEIIGAAVKKRASYVLENVETLTLATFRRLLESDLGLEEKGLDAFKGLVSQLVDKIFAQEVEEEPLAAAPGRKRARNGEESAVKKGDNSEVDGKSSKKVQDVKAKAVKKPVRRGRVELSDDDEAPAPKKIRGKAVKRGVDRDGDSFTERQKRPKLEVQKGSGNSKRSSAQQDSASGSEEDTGEEGNASKGKPKQVARGGKRGKASSSREDSEDGESESDGGSKKSRNANGRKASEPKQGSSKQVDHLKSIIKASGMTVPPSIYKKAKNAPAGKHETVLVKELESLLEREGLSGQASEKDIKAVRKRKEKLRDLEGIDSSNILPDRRGRRAASATLFAPTYSPTSSGDEDEEADDKSNEDEENDAEGEEEEEDGGSSGGEDNEEEEQEADESEGGGGDESE